MMTQLRQRRRFHNATLSFLPCERVGSNYEAYPESEHLMSKLTFSVQ
jgi:hypothetical protein